MKSLLYFTLLFLTISCQQEKKNEVQDKSDKKKTLNKIDLQNMDEEFIHQILKQELNADSLFTILNSKFEKGQYPLQYKSTFVNLDSDAQRELVIFIKDKRELGGDSYLSIIDNSKNKFLQIGFESLDQSLENIPIVDSINKMVIYKSRVNGTCDDGYKWIGYKLINEEFVKVIDFYGVHEGSSCGNYTEKDDVKKDFELYSTLESTFEFQNKNTLINICKISHWQYDDYMDTYTEKIITDKIIHLIYKFNNKTNKFECFNSDNQRLLDIDNLFGMSFDLVRLTKEGKL